MKILVINGPNINMLGIREKEIYGTKDYDYLKELIIEYCKKLNIEVNLKQSNYEGEIVTWIQDAYFEGFDGVIINPAGYTHTSVAIADAIKAISPIPVVEVHISDIDEREDFRKISYCSLYCISQIKGHGFDGYLMAIDLLKNSI
ncbi:MAG: type II 3-dehydroquinate dehydratase [Erysipelotrichaceae bacterium]|jgi:3-dehydroquinate dehydratase-2|nr:type II 3-dehydroquinate dehydratase [Bacillota bacterium]NLP22564.1 type II 3-dehydroquinate dehydratase [Erysipelotrichaceae bacterium]HCY06922.1 type II 3-dehydroquinate dehydratase [Erysipelotrichaceae bacterium]